MKLVFTGIQGCGKGTQARLLQEKYGFTIVEMGTEFRAVAKSDTDLGREIKAVVDSGKYVSEELGAKVMSTAIEKYKDEEKVIFDAFIRLDWNKRVFEEQVKDYKVIFFELSEEKAKGRLLGRMYNPTTGETFPSSVKVDPKTGEELVQRKDDNEAGILSRIEEYTTKTLPILKEQIKEGKVITINADQDIQVVHLELVEKLGLDSKKKEKVQKEDTCTSLFEKIKKFFTK